jgi:predicted transcriptional regulator
MPSPRRASPIRSLRRRSKESGQTLTILSARRNRCRRISRSTSQMGFTRERGVGVSAEGRAEPKRMVEDRRDGYGDPKSPHRIDRGGYIVAGGKEGDHAMPDEQPSEFVAKIVATYVRRNQVPPDQLASLISTVHHALGQLGKPAAEAEGPRIPAVSIRRSVHHDHVVCLDCGWKGQVLKRHIASGHGLTVEQYRARWNLLADHAMTAPAYSERRSTMAKQLGLGRGGRRGARETPELAAPESPAAAPRRRGRPRSTTTPA